VDRKTSLEKIQMARGRRSTFAARSLYMYCTHMFFLLQKQVQQYLAYNGIDFSLSLSPPIFYLPSMGECVHLWMYMYMYTYIHQRARVHTHSHTHAHTHAHTHIHQHMCTHIYDLYAYTHKHSLSLSHTHAHTQAHTCTHICTYVGSTRWPRKQSLACLPGHVEICSW